MTTRRINERFGKGNRKKEREEMKIIKECEN
jgi:hypothetical protein